MFEKDKIIVFFGRQSLSVWPGQAQTVSLSKELVNNLEIINEQELEKFIFDWLSKLKILKRNVVLVFSRDVVFEEFIPTTKSDATKLEQDFFNDTPIEDSIQSRKVVSIPKGKYLYGVNGRFIEVFKKALSRLNCNLVAAVPVSAFNVKSGGNSLDLADASIIIKGLRTIDLSNFIEKKKIPTESPDLVQEEHKLPKPSQGVLLGIGILLVVGALALVLFSLGIVKNPLSKNVAKPSPNASTTTQATPALKSGNSQENEATSEATRGATPSASFTAPIP